MLYSIHISVESAREPRAIHIRSVSDTPLARACSLSTISPVMPEKQNMPIWSVMWPQGSFEPLPSRAVRSAVRMEMMRWAMPRTWVWVGVHVHVYGGVRKCGAASKWRAGALAYRQGALAEPLEGRGPLY